MTSSVFLRQAGGVFWPLLRYERSVPRPPEGPDEDRFARPACGRVRITDVDISEHSRGPVSVAAAAAAAGPFAFGVAFT